MSVCIVSFQWCVLSPPPNLPVYTYVQSYRQGKKKRKKEKCLLSNNEKYEKKKSLQNLAISTLQVSLEIFEQNFIKTY